MVWSWIDFQWILSSSLHLVSTQSDPLISEIWAEVAPYTYTGLGTKGLNKVTCVITASWKYKCTYFLSCKGCHGYLYLGSIWDLPWALYLLLCINVHPFIFGLYPICTITLMLGAFTGGATASPTGGWLACHVHSQSRVSLSRIEPQHVSAK
jgi:hypothetical protein